MARTDPQVNIRMQAELKAQLEAAAAFSGRSLNSEIVERLMSTFSTPSVQISLKTIETQNGLISLLGKYLKMMASLAKSGNPDRLEQILLIEALAETLEHGDYEASAEVTGTMLDLANKPADKKMR